MADPSPRLEDRVFRYAERFALRHGLMEYPSLRAIARGLRTGARKVEEAVEGDGNGRMWTESFLTNYTPRSDEVYVAVDSPRIEAMFRRAMGFKEEANE